MLKRSASLIVLSRIVCLSFRAPYVFLDNARNGGCDVVLREQGERGEGWVWILPGCFRKLVDAGVIPSGS